MGPVSCVQCACLAAGLWWCEVSVCMFICVRV